MAKTERFLVIEQDQEIVRFNERLRQLRALSPEQRIKHFAARVHELHVGRDRRLHMHASTRVGMGLDGVRAVESLKLENGRFQGGAEMFQQGNSDIITDDYSSICWIIQLRTHLQGRRQGYLFESNLAGAGAHFISRFTKWRSALKPKTYQWSYCPIHDGQITLQVKEVSLLSILRSLIENGLDSCTMIAQKMDVSSGYVSRLASIAFREGWLKKNGRKYILVE